jgi:hypothetical protein
VTQVDNGTFVRWAPYEDLEPFSSCVSSRGGPARVGALHSTKLLVGQLSTKTTALPRSSVAHVSCHSAVHPQLDPPDQHDLCPPQKIGSRWRKLPAGRQALLILAHLRNGDTLLRLAAGFGIGVSTLWRYLREGIELLAACADTVGQVMARAVALAYAIPDGTR